MKLALASLLCYNVYANSDLGPQLESFKYYGGQVMVEGVNIYPIYYGNFKNETRLIFREFMLNLPKSAIWDTVSEYYKIQDGVKKYVSREINVMPDIVDPDYKAGKVFNDPSVKVKTWTSMLQVENWKSLNDVELYTKIVSMYYPKPDPKALYAIFTDEQVVSNLVGYGKACEDFLAYHYGSRLEGYGQDTFSITNIPACSAESFRKFYNVSETESPITGNDWQTVGMIDALKHELIEAVTNPSGEEDKSQWGWSDYDVSGNENEDLCTYIYAPYLKDELGRRYTIEFENGKRYFVQGTFSHTNAINTAIDPKKRCVMGNQNEQVKTFCPVGQGWNRVNGNAVECTPCLEGETSKGDQTKCEKIVSSLRQPSSSPRRFIPVSK